MEMGQSSFKCDAACNGLPRDLRELNTLSNFKIHIFMHFKELDQRNDSCVV